MTPPRCAFSAPPQGDAATGPRFLFQWREFEGPPVAPPKRHGFGSVLLEKAAAQDFETAPRVSYAPEGLSYEIDAPLSAVTAAHNEGRPESP